MHKVNMNSSCFPEPDILPSHPPSATSPVLLDPPELTIDQEEYLQNVIAQLHEDNDNRMDTGGAGDSLLHNENPAMDGIEDNDPKILVSEHSSSSSIFSTFAKSPSTPSKRKYTARTDSKPISDTPAPTKKPRTSSIKITSRMTPQKPAVGDMNEYRVVTLSNGIRAVLIKRPRLTNSGQVGARSTEDFKKAIEEALEQDRKFHSQHDSPFGQARFPLASLVMGEAFARLIEKNISSKNGKKGPPTSQEDFSQTSLYKHNRKNLEASVAVAVNVGHTDAPSNCLGLAHFLEHMVHYGSEKYPKEEEFFEFILTQGYDFNAFTQIHTTTYFHSIPLTCINKSMDMLASMLSSPKLENSMTKREINAVDSEFNLRKHHQVWQRIAVLEEAMAREEHPLGKFPCGNQATLNAPKDLQKVMRDFHRKHYVATAMTVGYESIQPFEQQEALLLDHFSSILRGNRGIRRETRPSAKEKLISGSLGKDFVLQGPCSLSNLWLLWPISEAFLDKFENKSLTVLSQLLWDEGEGSLAHFLMEKKYIWTMFCNSKLDYFMLDNKYTTFFTLDFMLTPEGQAHVPDIVNATLAFLGQLETVTDAEWQNVFKQMKLRQERVSTYTDSNTRDVFPLYISLAHALQTEEPNNILKVGSWQNATCSTREIRTILAHLKLQNMISIQTLPSTTPLGNYMNGAEIDELPYQDTEYVQQPIKKRFGNLTSKKQGSAPNLRALQSRLNLKQVVMQLTPPPNYGYIERQDIELQNTWGVKVMKAQHMGNEPGNYESFCLVNYINSDVMSTPRNFALTLLWITAQYLITTQEIKNNSDYSVAIIPHSVGVTIFFSGFEERMYSIIEAVNGKLFSAPVTEAKLSVAKTALRAIYDVVFATNTMSIFKDMMHFMLCNHSDDPLSEALSHIPNCSLVEVNKFSEAFKWKAMGYLLFSGNVSLPAATDVIDLINKQSLKYIRYFSTTRLILEEYLRTKTCFAYTNYIRAGEKCIRFKSENFYAATTTVQNFYCVGNYDPAEYMLWSHTLSLCRVKCFQYLRMIKQLGYSVGMSFPRPKDDQPMIIGVYVTSTASRFTACELDQHLDNFMVYYGQFLNELNQRSFEKMRSEVQSCGRDNNHYKVHLEDIQMWYEKHFGAKFASDDPLKYKKLGIYKLSMQMLANESKRCNCEKCQNISGWKTVNFWKHFKFAHGKSDHKNYFIDDPKRIRNA